LHKNGKKRTLSVKIPNFINDRFVTKDGYLTESSRHMLEQLFNELQQQMSDEGHIVPSQTTANITVLAADAEKKGAFYYDEDTDEVKVNIDGAPKVVQVV